MNIAVKPILVIAGALSLVGVVWNSASAHPSVSSLTEVDKGGKDGGSVELADKGGKDGGSVTEKGKEGGSVALAANAKEGGSIELVAKEDGGK
jgi:hypothetical protein